MSRHLFLRSGAVASFAAVILLVWQVLIGIGIGDEIALLSSSLDPARMTSFFQIDAPAVTLLMAADDAFAISYAVAFVALAVFLMAHTRYLAALALVFALLTALTDLSENSLTLAAVGTVSQNQPLEVGILTTLYWLGQMKYLLIYLAAILFGLGVWEWGNAGKVLAALFLVFPLIGIASIVVEAFVLLKLLWMAILLVAGGIFLLVNSRA